MTLDSRKAQVTHVPEDSRHEQEAALETKAQTSVAKFIAQSAKQQMSQEAVELRLLMSLSFALRRRSVGN